MAVEKVVTLILKAKDEASAVLDGAKTRLSGLGEAAKVVFAAMAAAAVAATAAITATVKSVLSWGDDLAKSADRMGITTEALGALRLAGDLAGVSAGELENMFRRMSRSIDDAVSGSTRQVEAFEALGISIADLSKQTPDQQFKTILGALDGIEDQSRKVALAYDLLGRSGTAAFNLTAEAIAAAEEEIKVFGIELNRVDAAKMEDVNDSFTRIRTAMKGVGVQLTLELLDPLKALAQRFVDLAKDGTLAEWGAKVGQVVGDLITWFEGLTHKTQDIGNAFSLLGGIFQSLVGVFQIAGNSLAVAILSPIEAILKVLNAATFGKIGFLDEAARQVEEFNDVAKKAVGDGVDRLKNGITQSGEAMSGLLDPTSQLTKELNNVGKESRDAGETTRQLAEEIKNTGDSMEDAADSAGKLAEEEKKVADESAKVATELAKARTEAAQFALEMEKLASNERIATIQGMFSLNTEKVKADAEVIKSTFSSI